IVLRDVATASALELPDGRELALALRPGPAGTDVPLRLAASIDGAVMEFLPGDEGPLPGGLTLAFLNATGSSATTTALPGGDGEWLVQMLHGADRSMLALVDPTGAQARLAPGEAVERGGYVYRFAG